MSKQNTQLKDKLRQNIANYNATRAVNLDLIDQKYLDKILAHVSDAELIMSDNKYDELSEEDQDKYYKAVADIYKQMQQDVDNMPIKLKMIGSQCKALKTKIKSAEYNAETLFWGAKIDNSLLSKMDKTKFSNEDEQIFDVTLIDVAMIHGILTNQTYDGLTYEAYLLAKLTVDITEYIKIYNHLKIRLDKLSEAIDIWDGTEEMKYQQALRQKEIR